MDSNLSTPHLTIPPPHPFHPNLHISSLLPFTCTFCLTHHKDTRLVPSFFTPRFTTYITCSAPSCRNIRCLDCALWDGVGVECGISHLSISADDDAVIVGKRKERKEREASEAAKVMEEWERMGREWDGEMEGTSMEDSEGGPDHGGVESLRITMSDEDSMENPE